MIGLGGDGGPKRASGEELRRLEAAARDLIRRAGAGARRNAFISFANEDLGKVNLLRGQAKREGSQLEFNDWSLKEPFDSQNAEYIRRGIRERIRQSSATIVFVSDATASSKWVDWEIRESVALGKRVIAVYAGDQAPEALPDAVVEYGISIVRWNHEELQSALE